MRSALARVNSLAMSAAVSGLLAVGSCGRMASTCSGSLSGSGSFLAESFVLAGGFVVAASSSEGSSMSMAC